MLTTNDLPTTVTKKLTNKKNTISTPIKTPVAPTTTVKKTAVKKATVAEKPAKPAATKATKKAAPKKTVAAKATQKVDSQIQVQLLCRFSTQYGQSLFVMGNHSMLGNNAIEHALPMQYIDEGAWAVNLSINSTEAPFTYNYVVKNTDGTVVVDAGSDKTIDAKNLAATNYQIIDSWNYLGYFENAFYTEPFQKVLLKNNDTPLKVAIPKTTTHIFKVKAPLLPKGKTLCLMGSVKALGNWSTNKPVLLSKKEDELYHSVAVNFQKQQGVVEYKYGVYNIETQTVEAIENGSNRFAVAGASNTVLIYNDGFARINFNLFKGAGIAIPVFSLKTNNSFGVGEFTDMPALVDWCLQVGLKLVQILPINDTTATHTWVDSYPYAAISAFALHPMYLNVAEVAGNTHAAIIAEYESKRIALNNETAVNYEEVLATKWTIIKTLFTHLAEPTFKTKRYQQFFTENQHWLAPYATFCVLRDAYQTADFNTWPQHNTCNAQTLATVFTEQTANIQLHYFVQYYLHIQLQAATAYAHSKGVIVKGDIPIGIYRFGADAWQAPHLYHMNVQAGAPPDDFAIKGQNWGFPTYNWQAMKQDGFAWWKQRFHQMSYYFDAFRIDHILGFFRIWSIPMHAVEGIMGYFVPSIPIHINEFYSQGIWFDYNRYTKPFINENVLWQLFGYDNDYVKHHFLTSDAYGNFFLQDAYHTQRKVEAYFANLEANDFNNKIKQGLYDIISNVILFEVEGSQGQQFHCRFNMAATSSFQQLDKHTQQQLEGLYVNYFFRRQDNYWMQEAIQKLPALKRVTNMLVCGEDLGLVPDCVPDVMEQLGILSLEIQRMPKDNNRKFFHPNDAPYLSVVTPSTHDMSTIRGWWEEDKEGIQHFFNHELGQWGDAPYYCSGWINKAIVNQHLYSPAMWSIFQLQDILGIDDTIRRENPNDERINIPANPKHYWQYRMHISIENLQANTAFTNEFGGMIKNSGR
jgi:4-alpha-glucanotransferase